MRVLWLIGGTEELRLSLENELKRYAPHVLYLVRRAELIDEIPEAHMQDPGVVLLLDAFSPYHPGFEGIKLARHQGFKGKLLLFGEPAPELAAKSFKKHKLSGYFPSFQRADMALSTGLIHYSLYYDGIIDFQHFLLPGGRAASEKINSLADFNAFNTKFANFVGRFGVNLAHLRKVLMGLSLAHVKSGVPGAQMDDSFKIHYGLDKQKIILGTTSLSKGATAEHIFEEFSDILSEIKSVNASQKVALLPEMHHVARSAENMVLFSGNAKIEKAEVDPMHLITMVPFPGSKHGEVSSYYQFLCAHVELSAEMSEENAFLEKELSKASAATDDKQSEAEEDTANSQRPEVSTIESVQMEQIEAVPIVSGDQPEVLPALDELKNQHQQENGSTPAEAADLVENDNAPTPSSSLDDKERQKLESELESARALASAMAADIKRLMKERRVPSSDTELKKSFEEITSEKIELLKEIEKLRCSLKDQNEKSPAKPQGGKDDEAA